MPGESLLFMIFHEKLYNEAALCNVWSTHGIPLAKAEAARMWD
jgi:hypothetical protein